MIRELAEHPGVVIVTEDMCDGECICLKKVIIRELTSPFLLNHEMDDKLEGAKRTLQASNYPTALVQGTLNTLKRVKVRLADANHARDPTHFTIPESL